ncbi:peptidase C14 [Anaeromyces robustus]|uniref:Peptidase C14 n=1 Tax=Anaeromyces robustus TaxID=1754192 RepID=A0A1Y1X4Q3_9FUNG|nr:peptidase C14 [Anaeromyces robustus]|eukprot:ORX80763.1 peptidase C14 [Anaeromyces robustus]
MAAAPEKKGAKKTVKKVVKKKVVKKNPVNVTDNVHNQIKIQEVWSKDIKKFYEERDGDNFVRSDCSGKKKGVFIGINYVNSKHKLMGCVSDAINISELFKNKFGFKDIMVLTDESKDEKQKPTHNNITNAMKWLVKDAKAGDSLIFHFSGHGARVKDNNGDEMDGFDESIIPCDFGSKGRIIDDKIHQLLVEPLPKGCKLTAIFDCCHSGTIMDLPYTYQYKQDVEVIDNDVRKAIFEKTNDVVKTINTGNPAAIADSLKSIFDGSLRKAASNGIDPATIKKLQSKGEVIQISSCRDDQKSTDIKMGKVKSGVMSHYLMKLLNDKKEYTIHELLVGIRKCIADRKFAQIPQISSNRPLSPNDKFTV